jgi:hypothetical protein
VVSTYTDLIERNIYHSSFGGFRRVWRYQRGNQNQYIEEEQTTQWSKEKGQKDKQRSTKHTYKTKDWVTRTPLKIGGELSCSGMVSSSCSIGDTVDNERGKDLEVFTTKTIKFQFDTFRLITSDM